MSKIKKLRNEDIANKKNLLHIVNDGRFRVAIFGSARIKPGDTVYQEVAELARKLATNGYDIVTGGGPGAMEAASY
jgi:predicted Rossmann-fold nucleotide-binding protein